MISTSRTSDFQISGSAISSHKNIQGALESDKIDKIYGGKNGMTSLVVMTVLLQMQSLTALPMTVIE